MSPQVVSGRNRRALIVLALAVAASSAVYATTAARATPSEGLTTTILTKALFDSMDIKAQAKSEPKATPKFRWLAKLNTKGLTDVYVVDNKIAPGGTTGWHSHPGPSLILVVAGTVTNYESGDCTPHVYSQGSGFIDEGGADVHTLRNEGSVPAETIAVQLLPKDAVRKTDLPAPATCPH